MRVLYSPQINEKDTLGYVFSGSKVTVTYNGQSYNYDFTNLSNGKATSYGSSPTIVSKLPINPVIDVVNDNGILSVRLLKFISANATNLEGFLEWFEV